MEQIPELDNTHHCIWTIIHQLVCLLLMSHYIRLLSQQRYLFRTLQERNISSNQGRLGIRVRHWRQERHWRLFEHESWSYARKANQDNTMAYNPINHQPSLPLSKHNNRKGAGACAKYPWMQYRGPQVWRPLPPLCIHHAAHLFQKEHALWHCISHSPVCAILRGPKSASWRFSQKFGQIPSSKKNDRIILNPEKPQSLEVYTDSNFSRNWHNPKSPKDVRAAKSHMSYAVIYAVCLVVLYSRI